MSETAGIDLASIPERIQLEVQRAIKRSIKGVEYFTSSGPALGLTPKDVLSVRGTMNLYHYRPVADEIYRVPILIVMATTNRGYILDMVPGQSLVEFLLKRGYDVYMLDWTAPKPEEKNLRMEDYVLDFIPYCIRRIQQDSGETDVSVIGYCFGGVLSLLYGAIFHDGPMKNLVCFTTPIDFREMKLFANFADRRYFDVDRLVDSVGNMPPEMILSSFEMLRPASRADEAAVLDFAQKLPTRDLLFLPRNISQPKVLSAWINEIERGDITSLLAIRDGKVVGCSALVRDRHSWSPHVGEIRAVVSLDVRGQGVGRALSQETFALALDAGLEKLSVQMIVDQQAAITLFESLGFKAEALLREHVRDVDGRKHDIVVLGHNVAQVQAQLEAYGIAEAMQQ